MGFTIDSDYELKDIGLTIPSLYVTVNGKLHIQKKSAMASPNASPNQGLSSFTHYITYYYSIYASQPQQPQSGSLQPIPLLRVLSESSALLEINDSDLLENSPFKLVYDALKAKFISENSELTFTDC